MPDGDPFMFQLKNAQEKTNELLQRLLDKAEEANRLLRLLTKE